MATEDTVGAAKRSYRRRTDEERIADLEAKIQDIRTRQKQKERRTSPVLQEIPKVQRRLRKFAQMAMDHQRPDIANSTTAFVTALERFLDAREDTRARAASDA